MVFYNIKMYIILDSSNQNDIHFSMGERNKENFINFRIKISNTIDGIIYLYACKCVNINVCIIYLHRESV